MLKLNKKGFALVETLIVSVFVMAIFTVLYTNLFPMMGEYERREYYDDIDSIYKTYDIFKKANKEDIYKRYTINTSNPGSFITIFSADYNENKDSDGCYQIDIKKEEIINSCNAISTNEENRNYCINLFTEIKATRVYLTRYTIKDLKNAVKKDSNSVNSIDSSTKDYINTLPYYKKGSDEHTFRIIVEYVKEINSASCESRKTINTFSTIGVDLL